MYHWLHSLYTRCLDAFVASTFPTIGSNFSLWEIFNSFIRVYDSNTTCLLSSTTIKRSSSYVSSNTRTIVSNRAFMFKRNERAAFLARETGIFLKTDSDEFRSRRQRMQQRYCSMLVHLFPERGLILISAIPATKIDISTGSNSCAYSVVIFNIAKSTPCVVDRSFSRRLGQIPYSILLVLVLLRSAQSSNRHL